MRLTKSELKSVVKECLIEILNEGLGGAAGQFQTKSAMSPGRVFPESNQRLPMQRSAPPQAQKRPTPQLRDAVRAEAGGNKIMESILADTAASTLPKMLEGEGRKAPVSGGLAEQVVASASPEDLFGDEAASKWADLAFMGMQQK